MEQAMEQTLQALQALYSSPDPATKKQADDWLTQFQQTPLAWQVSDQILSNNDTLTQFRFFAAQTMRTKVQFDFYELPAESYGSLRDSLLNHIDRFRAADCHAIHTMLAITIADLAIQMDSAWPNACSTLFERFGQNPDSYTTLLEVMQMLPEECMNYKLMTDTHKRDNSSERLKQATPQVVQFLLTLTCPNVQAKKKVLDCFLSWIKFTDLQVGDIAQNPLIPECFKYVFEGGELSETATDIIIEILRMSSQELRFFQPVIEVILSHLPYLQTKFDNLAGQSMEESMDKDHEDALLQICRIYVETAEALIPLIMDKSSSQEVINILRVILRCSGMPSQEISTIPLEFWHRLAAEVCRHPETDPKFDRFQGIYTELLSIMIRRCTVPTDEDPFQADDEYIAYRGRFLSLAEDCLDILTPNAALEHVLKSLQDGQRQGVTTQEAHFFCLTRVGARAEVREASVLWQLIQSLPPLISQTIEETSKEAALLHYTKKTAIELLGCLSKWVKTRPDFLRSSLEMISTLLLQTVPPDSAPHILERTKQVQQTAAMAFKEICYGGVVTLQDLVPQLTQLYVQTMGLPIRMHLFIVDGVGQVVARLQQDATFEAGLEQLVMPLVNGLNSEREKPQVLSEILDRLTTIIRQISVDLAAAKAGKVGTLVSNVFWPLIRQTLSQHPGDSKVVEKSIRLLKHSMRCVPDLFKPNVSAVASTLIQAFQQFQHSSYLYSAEILANTYASDPEIVPILTQLFHALSSTALHVLVNARDQSKLEEITELVEDFYGMFERFLRYAPLIVLEAPTLMPTLELWKAAIFVQQKDAIEAVIAFVEAVLGLIADASKSGRGYDERRVALGQRLRPHALQVCPGFIESIFRLINGVPTRYVQESLPCVIDVVRAAFPQEFPGWLEAAVGQLPPSVASPAERQKLGEQLLHGDYQLAEDAVKDLCYRCEQVALRSRANLSGGKS